MSEPKPIDPFEMEAIAAISRSQVLQAREPELTPGKIWQTLSRVDCSAHIEKKGNLNYLSWAWALGIMMEHYPEMEFYIADDEVQQDGTILVNVIVTIGNMTRKMWLPVMDNRSNAVKNPDAFKINTTRMRCLTKCFALFGLGHYIYAGEDLPQSDEVDPESDANAGYITKHQYDDLMGHAELAGADIGKFCEWLGIEELADLKYKDFDYAYSAMCEKLQRKVKEETQKEIKNESE